MLWGRFVPRQDMQTLLRCHAAAFETLGGAPAEILYDRMRTVFSRKDPDAGHIVYNRTLIEFARHYGYLPKACRAYRAKTKGKVERPFRYIREDFFLGRSFRNTPPPANSNTPRHGPPLTRSGDVVALRPLAFYDAVGRRLAADGASA